MKMSLLYQVSHYIRVKKQRNIKNWDQQNYLVIRGFCYIRPLYNEVPLYQKFESGVPVNFLIHLQITDDGKNSLPWLSRMEKVCRQMHSAVRDKLNLGK